MTTKNDLVARVRGSLTPEDCLSLYAEWAGTYDADVAATENYVAPAIVAEIALRLTHHSVESGAPLLDAGCGTGLVGRALAQGGAIIIDGLDLSPAMLREAEKTGLYRHLTVGDLTEPIAKPDDQYAAVVCVGTFTLGHVGPSPALEEFVRITRKDGFVIATILDEIWKSGKYQAVIEDLEARNQVEVIGTDAEDYRKGRDKARVVILKKKGGCAPQAN